MAHKTRTRDYFCPVCRKPLTREEYDSALGLYDERQEDLARREKEIETRENDFQKEKARLILEARRAKEKGIEVGREAERKRAARALAAEREAVERRARQVEKREATFHREKEELLAKAKASMEKGIEQGIQSERRAERLLAVQGSLLRQYLIPRHRAHLTDCGVGEMSRTDVKLVSSAVYDDQKWRRNSREIDEESPELIEERNLQRFSFVAPPTTISSLARSAANVRCAARPSSVSDGYSATISSRLAPPASSSRMKSTLKRSRECMACRPAGRGVIPPPSKLLLRSSWPAQATSARGELTRFIVSRFSGRAQRD